MVEDGKMSTPASEGSSAYFLTEMSDEKPTTGQRLRPIFDAIKYYAIRVWPYVQKIINTVVYFIITLIKGIVKLMIEQIKNFRE